MNVNNFFRSHPLVQPHRTIVSLGTRARFYRNINKINEAVTSYNKAIEYRPDFAKAYNNLGNLYNAANKIEEAIAYFKKAILPKFGSFS